MNNTLIIIIGLGVLGFGVWRVWRIWDERFAGRSMREQEREMALLAELQKAQTEAPETLLVMDPPVPRRRSARPTPDAASSAAPTAATAATPAASTSAILDAAGRVVFYMLKIAMPDHEILARVDTAALAGNSETLPPRAMLDFVVCKRDFTPVAVIVLMRGEDPLRDRAATLLEQRGLRVLRWAINALPERASVRAIVLGEDPQLPQSTSAA